MSPPSKVAIVTGAGSGIGRCVAIALLNDGYSVVLAGRHMSSLDATERGANCLPGTSLVVQTDVANPDSVQHMFMEVKKVFGRLDLLFNNAGIFGANVPLEDMSYDNWQAVVQTNLTDAFLCTQEAFKMMKEQNPRGGRIINNGSVSAYSPRPNAASYTATKHALTGLTKATSLEGRKYDIACGQIDIGNAATQMVEGLGTDPMQANGTNSPEPTMDLGHVARMILYMASLPLDTNVQFVTILPTKMPLIGRG